jgi:hypothetical protein
MNEWNGLGVGLGNLSRLARARTRSITAENRDGSKGGGARATTGISAEMAADLGVGWKISPCDEVEPGETLEIANIEGPGVIQHIWMTFTGHWRYAILRFYWDDSEVPSVEVPVGDFFCCGWGRYAQVNALPVNVNPGSAFNCYWEMPFRKRCRITVENLSAEKIVAFYQVDYALCEVPDDCAYFHAQWRRENPVPRGEVYTILDGVKGRGHYVGTYMCWGVTNCGWWGEGELKFYLDGDDEFPTICGTGTEDYFGGSYNFEVDKAYREFTAPFLGMPQVIRPDGLYDSQQRFGLYRFHVMDPVRFEEDLRVTIQCLGWRNGPSRYLTRQDDLASTAFWYQTLPVGLFPELPGMEVLEVV